MKALPILSQPPNNTTLLGVAKAVAGYYDFGLTDAFLYGASGHAFLINIHEELCPSGPYVWNLEPFRVCCRHLGLDISMFGCFSPSAPPAGKADVEARIRAAVDAGIPCSLLQLENQLIASYDDAGFQITRPWPLDLLASRVSFGTWDELDKATPTLFFAWNRCAGSARATAIQASLRYAVDLWDNPARHECDRYGVGPRAYAKWADAIRAGHGASHGNWWNATVWAECRAMAGDYLDEIAAERVSEAAEWRSLAAHYRGIGGLLDRAKARDLGDAPKLALIAEAAALEEGAIERIRGLLAKFEQLPG